MDEPSSFQTKSMKRKNIRNLDLNGTARPAPPPAVAKNDVGDALEIGVEFRLDLRSEDLVVLRELGAGNSGTVSKVQHTATKAIMARKVRPVCRRLESC
jgi:mitogen-activated protein kinase kinase